LDRRLPRGIGEHWIDNSKVLDTIKEVLKVQADIDA
jgi:hypothetical protein